MSPDDLRSSRGPAPPCDPTVVDSDSDPAEGHPPSDKRGSWLKRILTRMGAASRPAGAGRAARVFRGAVPNEKDRFVRSGRIGEGGMATVELQIDRALRRKTAIKLLLPEMESEIQAVQSLLREAQVNAQLAHPNIAPVYDLGMTDDERPFFTMQLLDARTLTEVVADLPAGPLERGQLFDLLEMVLRVCDALAHAHKNGVIHRDVKPDNVMVGDFNQVYLVDWGLARLTEVKASGGREQEPVSSSFGKIWGARVIGSPAYMPPEQAAGSQVDERSDVFAVGGLLYFLLARRPPYGGSSPEEVLERARRSDFTPLQEAAAPGGVPRELDRIVTRALAGRPEDRHQGVVDLREDIVAFMRGGSLPRIAFERGHEIIREGDVGEHAYIIVSGRCEVLKSTAGERRRIRTIGSGECFGETAIMTAERRTASVVAIEDTLVERVTREELLEELDGMKPWVSVFLRSLAEWFRERETTAS